MARLGVVLDASTKTLAHQQLLCVGEGRASGNARMLVEVAEATSVCAVVIVKARDGRFAPRASLNEPLVMSWTMWIRLAPNTSDRDAMKPGR